MDLLQKVKMHHSEMNVDRSLVKERVLFQKEHDAMLLRYDYRTYFLFSIDFEFLFLYDCRCRW